MSTELEKLDYNLKSLKLFLEGAEQVKMLDRDIQKFSGGASKDTRYQNEMSAAKKRDVKAFERRIEEIESRIRAERNRMKRKGGEVDAAYRDAFERKVSEVEAYVSSLGITLKTE